LTEPPSAAAYFGDRAAFYNDRYDMPDADGHALRARMSVVLALVGNGPGSVLDAGMGPGRLCVELAKQGWTPSGVDAADEMVAVARRRLPDAAARLIRAEIEALPFPDERFDAVTATGVLEYTDVPRVLAEVARVLRPGGLAVVSYPNPSALYGIWKSRVWYTGIRVAKRSLRRPGAAFPRGGGLLSPERFEQLLAGANLLMTAAKHASYLLLPTPLDLAAPRLAMRLGERLERSGPRLAPRLATQIVYAARKTG
jgi:ubiquinone/menaquinone biosynthesis C-methylase UbiE